jgi:phage terminase large subunit-like protein
VAHRARKQSGPRDFVAVADAFARRAVADVRGESNCRWIRLAASRYLRMRKTAAEKGGSYRFSRQIVQQVCEFIELLPHVEGKWDSPTIVLHESHVFFLVNLFGFRVRASGCRLFTIALLAVARKNAKSTLAAAILLYCLFYENEQGAQVITAATTGDQARIIFNIAKRMLEKSAQDDPETGGLIGAFGAQVFASALVNPEIGGNLKPINAHASTQDGLNPSHTALDEIHAHKNADLLNVLQSAAGARDNPLWLYTTTEGYETPGPWPELRAFARQVLEGMVEADHFFALMFALDDEVGKEGEPGYQPADDDFDESKWIKANPLLRVNPVLEREIRKAAIQAKHMPSTHAEFRIKRLNRQSAGARTWLNIDRWKRCAQPIDLKAMEALDCWAAIDAASTTDIMAARFVWKDKAGHVYTWGRRWVPAEAVAQRTERGTVPYAGWVELGLITMQDGNVLDYEKIEKELIPLFQRFRPKIIAYDSWNFRNTAANLAAKDYPMREFIQGPKSYHPAMKEAERLYLIGALHHGGDPVLNWCAANVVPRYDANLNMAPDKKKSADKIDDAAALFMAIGVMSEPEPEKPKFQLFAVGGHATQPQKPAKP